MPADRKSPIPKLAKVMLIKSAVKILQVQRVFHFETVCPIIYIRDERCSTHTCFKFRIVKGSVQVAYNSKYVALRNQCRLDCFREVVKCRLKPLG